MRFLPKTTCEKLVKMGCETLSRHFWHGDNESPFCINNIAWHIPNEWEPLIKAFTLEDFVSTDEYAKENCRKIWPDKSEDGKFSFKYKMNTPKGEWVTHSDFFRQEIIKSKDWVEFISKAVEGYEKRKEKN